MLIAMFFNRIQPCALNKLIQPRSAAGPGLGMWVKAALSLGLLHQIGKINPGFGAGALNRIHNAFGGLAAKSR